MIFISMSLLIFILQKKKNVKLSHFYDVIEKELFYSNSKENHFVVSKMLNFLMVVLLTQKRKILILSSSTLAEVLLYSKHFFHLKGLCRFLSCAVKINGSEAYINMIMIRECTSFTVDPRDMLLSLQIIFSFARAAVA